MADRPYDLDDVDRRLLDALGRSPRAGVAALAREVGVARATAQARLDRLGTAGVVTGFGPEVDLRAVGYRVEAFVNLEIAQGRGDDVVAHLRGVPEVVEAHMTTGPSDLLCRVVATDNDHLGRVLNRLLEVRGIVRTATSLVLSTQVRHRRLQVLTGRSEGPPTR